MAKRAKKKVKKVKKRVARKSRAAGAKTAAKITAKIHSAAFSQLVAHAHEHNKPPVCYIEYPDGSAEVCKLMPDGTYGDCESYNLRPVPGPRCG